MYLMNIPSVGAVVVVEVGRVVVDCIVVEEVDVGLVVVVDVVRLVVVVEVGDVVEVVVETKSINLNDPEAEGG